MIEAHKHALFWLAYIVVVILAVGVGIISGLFWLVWQYDVTLLSSIILLTWLFTEIVGGYQLIKLDLQISNSQQMFLVPSIDENDLWNRHSFVSFMSEIVVAAGIFGTVIGVIMALMPFFGMSSFDIATVQPHLLKMFSGIAVAFFPTAISIAVKMFLDFHSRLHQNAVIHLLSLQRKT